MNAILYHVFSGQAFFSGLLVVVLAIAFPATWLRPRLSGLRAIFACLGTLLIAISAAPLPPWWYAVSGVAIASWIAFAGRLGRSRGRVRAVTTGAVLACVASGLALELPYQWSPHLPRLGSPTLDVIGDSLSAGEHEMGIESWPEILARVHRLNVRNMAHAGASASGALSQADRIAGGSAPVLLEIGGNDILGRTPPAEFERSLDLLLARLRSGGWPVILLELPLPPLHNAYGRIQRRQARKHGAYLVPKRVLVGVLTSDGATTDTIHLSRQGQERMAESLWAVLRPAYGR